MSVRKSVILCLSFLLLAPSFANAQEAQPEPPAATFDALLQRVQAGWRSERSQNRKREQEFVARRQDQKKLLAQAVATRKQEEARSERLERQFEANEREIASLEDQLTERLGTLGELFGVVRQVAGDTRGHLETSLVSAQLPGRADALASIAETKRLPSVDQLELLWHALLEEAVESGKVVRFPTTVVQSGGGEAEKEVVRVGVFNAVSDGKYLAWAPELDRLKELDRQPPGSYLGTVSALEGASDGIVKFAIDPSRGSILSLLVQTPNLRERIEFGGPIGYMIILLGAVTGLLALARLAYVFLTSRQVSSQKGNGSPDKGNPLGRVLSVYTENHDVDAETLELKLDEAILRESSSLESYLWAIKVVSVVAPLMGLLGTVTGMIQTFQAITLFGTGDPKLMAGGISEALVTTMLGLIVAIPLVLLHSWVSSMTKGVVDVLEEQSAGLVARQAESESGAAA